MKRRFSSEAVGQLGGAGQGITLEQTPIFRQPNVLWRAGTHCCLKAHTRTQRSTHSCVDSCASEENHAAQDGREDKPAASAAGFCITTSSLVNKDIVFAVQTQPKVNVCVCVGEREVPGQSNNEQVKLY